MTIPSVSFYRHAQAPTKIRQLTQTTQYQGHFQLDELRYQHQKFDGTWSSTITRERFERGDAVVVILVDVNRQQLVLVEQCRTGAIGKDMPWLLEPVAGGIDSTESPLLAAVREVEEETGLTITADQLHELGCVYPTPGACSERFFLYLAEVDVCQVKDHAGLIVEEEDIRVHVLPFELLKTALLNGHINTVSTQLAVLHVQLHYGWC